jgi:hypothetical protein
MKRVSITVGIVWLIASGAQAHHSLPAHYIPEELITITGVVDEFRFQNPHAVIYVVVTDDEGAESLWTVEWAGSGALRRRGILPEAIQPGDRVSLLGHPARDGSQGMALNTISFEDGRPSIGPPNRGGSPE